MVIKVSKCFILLILACHSRVLVYLLISIPPPTQPTTVWLSSVCPLSVILLNDFPGLLSTLHTWLVLIILNIVMPVLCLYLCTVNTVNQTNNQVSVLHAVLGCMERVNKHRLTGQTTVRQCKGECKYSSPLSSHHHRRQTILDIINHWLTPSAHGTASQTLNPWGRTISVKTNKMSSWLKEPSIGNLPLTKYNN